MLCGFYAKASAWLPPEGIYEKNKAKKTLVRQKKKKTRKAKREREENVKTITFRGIVIPNILIPSISVQRLDALVVKKSRQQGIDEIKNGEIWNGRKVKLSMYAPIDYNETQEDHPPFSP